MAAICTARELPRAPRRCRRHWRISHAHAATAASTQSLSPALMKLLSLPTHALWQVVDPPPRVGGSTVETVDDLVAKLKAEGLV